MRRTCSTHSVDFARSGRVPLVEQECHEKPDDNKSGFSGRAGRVCKELTAQLDKAVRGSFYSVTVQR